MTLTFVDQTTNLFIGYQPLNFETGYFQQLDEAEYQPDLGGYSEAFGFMREDGIKHT